ncbi:MAG: DUF2384 domain-containing protein [Rhodospirillales bacterium]|nr:DUF2384 domain-containing protein [Rhodospirillales bacterium]
MSLVQVQVGSLTPSEKPAITDDHVGAGMRAVFTIAEKWGLLNEDIRTLLGSPGRATFFKWKKGDIGNVSHDTVSRISYILGIYKALHILYADPAQADDWVNRSNLVFGGEAAKSRMIAGEMADLAFVRDYLDGVRGGWS